MKKQYPKLYERVSLFERKVSIEIYDITDEKHIQRNIDNRYKKICKSIRLGLLTEEQTIESLRLD